MYHLIFMYMFYRQDWQKNFMTILLSLYVLKLMIIILLLFKINCRSLNTLHECYQDTLTLVTINRVRP